jgi:hypothetical protein
VSLAVGPGPETRRPSPPPGGHRSSPSWSRRLAHPGSRRHRCEGSSPIVAPMRTGACARPRSSRASRCVRAPVPNASRCPRVGRTLIETRHTCEPLADRTQERCLWRDEHHAGLGHRPDMGNRHPHGDWREQPRRVVQLLTEAVLVCFIGGLVGVVAGTGGGLSTSAIAGWRVIVTVAPMGIAFACAFLTGITLGYLPTRKAA